MDYKEGCTIARFHVHEFLFSYAILVDCENKTLTLYNTNAVGAIYNLASTYAHAYSTKKILGLIRRSNHPNYYKTSYAVDCYLRTYFMTAEQQRECPRVHDITDPHICSSDSFHEAITKMCDHFYHEAQKRRGQEAQNYNTFMQYREDYLATSPQPPAPQKPEKTKSR